MAYLQSAPSPDLRFLRRVPPPAELLSPAFSGLGAWQREKLPLVDVTSIAVIMGNLLNITCVYICTYIHIYTYTYTNTNTYTYIHIYIYTYIHIYIYTYIHIHIDIHIHRHIHIHIWIHTYIYITLHYITSHYITSHYITLHTLHIYIYIHTYTCAYIYIYIFRLYTYTFTFIHIYIYTYTYIDIHYISIIYIYIYVRRSKLNSCGEDMASLHKAPYRYTQSQHLFHQLGRIAAGRGGSRLGIGFLFPLRWYLQGNSNFYVITKADVDSFS